MRAKACSYIATRGGLLLRSVLPLVIGSEKHQVREPSMKVPLSLDILFALPSSSPLKGGSWYFNFTTHWSPNSTPCRRRLPYFRQTTWLSPISVTNTCQSLPSPLEKACCTPSFGAPKQIITFEWTQISNDFETDNCPIIQKSMWVTLSWYIYIYIYMFLGGSRSSYQL